VTAQGTTIFNAPQAKLVKQMSWAPTASDGRSAAGTTSDASTTAPSPMDIHVDGQLQVDTADGLVSHFAPRWVTLVQGRLHVFQDRDDATAAATFALSDAVRYGIGGEGIAGRDCRLMERLRSHSQASTVFCRIERGEGAHLSADAPATGVLCRIQFRNGAVVRLKAETEADMDRWWQGAGAHPPGTRHDGRRDPP